jgi:anti-anti-sigma regulatory factor
MIQIETDKAANLLKISFRGRVNAKEMKGHVENVRVALEQMETGFRLLTDLSGLESMELDSMSAIEQTMDLCNRKGISLVVRVIPDPKKDIGLNIMSLFHYRRGVRIVTCETLADAQQALAV